MSSEELDIDDDDAGGWFVCVGCGFGFAALEIGGEFDGHFVDYDMRMQGTANFVYCGECWEEVKQNLATPVKKAKARRMKLIRDMVGTDVASLP